MLILVAVQDEEDAVEPVLKTHTALRNDSAGLGGDPIMKVSPDLVSFSFQGTLLAADVWVSCYVFHSFHLISIHYWDCII